MLVDGSENLRVVVKSTATLPSSSATQRLKATQKTIRPRFFRGVLDDCRTCRSLTSQQEDRGGG